MDDMEVCPLCCEELDISDQQFFPCKCGYQVCMWCWHRIKEQETGLCPACRTPYGDDPHEFSAVDMEEVLKANKEKAAAEKREKERLRLSQTATAAGVAAMHIGGGSDVDSAVVSSSGSRSQSEPPRDRNQLANMRVIRRNLVYTVGLPPAIVTEDILKKAEYFGQYGKIAKIVVNRSNSTSGDPRRASASAYVTFVYPEDALACILALDGFYLDGRNIRVSFGTSKYCSAFIKNVKCNNPECTYLHCMGDSEDTFTKQEIQAGYVTSGRDVLARQQQLAAASAGPNPRRRIGSPSGTGKVTSNPIFPQPTYDEPSKLNLVNVAPAPPPPATNSTTQFPTIGSATSMQRTASTNVPITAASKPIRASSLPFLVDSSIPAGEMSSRQQDEIRRQLPSTDIGGHSSSEAFDTASSILNVAPTAASVLVGGHTTNRPSQSTPHATLTALTPLTRSKSLIDKKDSSKFSTLRSSSSTQPTTGASIPSGNAASIGSIGGNIIEPPLGRNGSNIGSIGVSLAVENTFRGQSKSDFSNTSSTFGGSSLLFGALDEQSKSADGADLLFNPVASNRGFVGGGNGLWDDDKNTSPFRNDLLSGSPLKLTDSSSRTIVGNSYNSGTSGSSALASMLGIQLPSGAGSLRETLWASSTPLNPPNNETKLHIPAPIGSGMKKTSDNVIIGGSTRGGAGVPIIGFGSSTSSNGGNKSDIALLQSLLPGVHITSGNSTPQSAQNTNGVHNPFAGSGWGGLGSSGFSSLNEMQQQSQVGGDSWSLASNRNSNNGIYSAAPGSQNQSNNKKQGPIW